MNGYTTLADYHVNLHFSQVRILNFYFMGVVRKWWAGLIRMYKNNIASYVPELV